MVAERWYSVGIDADAAPLSAEQAERYVDAIEEIAWLRGPAISGGEGYPGVGFQASVRSPHPSAAAARALKGFLQAVANAGISVLDVGRVDVMTEEYLERWLDREPDRYVGVAEVARLLEVSKQRVSQLRDSEDFPEPVAELEAGPVWPAANIEAFARTSLRKPGRPAARMHAIVSEELEHIHKGPRGSPQNILRMVYQAMRKHRLSEGDVRTAWDVFQEASALVRRHAPEARFQFDEEWFRGRS